MRIIKVPSLVKAAKDYPKSTKWIENWCSVVKKADWKSIQDIRASYPSADSVTLDSENKVVVFNVCGNDFRLIVAIHYNRKIVYTLRFLTHSEYSKDKWKKEL